MIADAGRRRPRRRLPGAALVVAGAVLFAPVLARAQPVPHPNPAGTKAPAAGAGATGTKAPAWKAPPGIADAVAKALYKRGMALFHHKDYADAKEMFVESLQRSPAGSSAAAATRMLARANHKLGLPARDGLAKSPGEGGASQPLNPYGAAKNSSSAGNSAGGPINPYAKAAGNGSHATATVEAATPGAGTGLLVWSGAYGLTAGLAIAGPEDSGRQVKGGAVLAGLVGAGATAGLTYFLARHRRITPAQAEAIASAGTWGGYTMGLLGDVFTGVGTSTPNEIYKFVAGGALAGAGAGIWYAASDAPSEGDVWFANSFGLYGTSAGLLLGVAMNPPTGEAYSLNAAIGSVLGLGAGLFLADRVHASRSRMLKVDLGAAAGAAAPWVLLYPFISDSSKSIDEQVTGIVSVLALGGGAYLAWRLTSGDDGDGADNGGDASSQAPLALARRSAAGRWRLGLPMPMPMPMATPAPESAGRRLALGFAVAAGRF